MEKITSSSLSRLYKYYKAYDSGTISAFRYYRSLKNNKALSIQLKKILNNLGFITVKISGVSEEIHDGKAVKVNEDAYIVFDVHKKGNLKKTLMKLGEKYDQDTICYTNVETGKYYLIGTNHKTDIGYHKALKLGKPMFGKSGQFYSQINGRPFIFNKLDDSELNEGLVEEKVISSFRMTSKIDEKFVEQFYDNYDLFYDDRTTSFNGHFKELYRKALNKFNELFDKNDRRFMTILDQFDNYRQDAVASDRECAAFICTISDLNLIKDVNKTLDLLKGGLLVTYGEDTPKSRKVLKKLDDFYTKTKNTFKEVENIFKNFKGKTMTASYEDGITYIPFDGFYNSYSDSVSDSFLENEYEHYQELAEEKGIDLDKLDIDMIDYFDYRAWAKSYAKEYCDYVIGIIDDGFGGKTGITIQGLNSPRFYNYETDRIDVFIPEKTVEKMEQIIGEERLEEIKDSIKNGSHSGFIMFDNFYNYGHALILEMIEKAGEDPDDLSYNFMEDCSSYESCDSFFDYEKFEKDTGIGE